MDAMLALNQANDSSNKKGSVSRFNNQLPILYAPYNMGGMVMGFEIQTRAIDSGRLTRNKMAVAAAATI